jgi:hypothetical protein
VLARSAGEVEAAAQRGRVLPSDRMKFQVVAVLAREERARVRAEVTSDARRSATLKRLDGIAVTLARAATRDTSLLTLLAEDAVLSGEARSLTRKLLKDAGREVKPLELTPPEPLVASAPAERGVVPQTVVSRQMANPFLAPDFSAVGPAAAPPARRQATWELLGPLLRSF